MDLSSDLQASVIEAAGSHTALNIVGGNSKSFYGRTPTGTSLEVSGNSGIIDYQPGELTLTARGGTSLSEIYSVLDEHKQMLPFEPPSFGEHATLAGTVACGLAGPRRPWTGSVRDYLLGVRVLTGTGKDLRIGSPIMKNVAGYDLFRPMARAMGTLGILLEVTLKVLPSPACELSLSMDCTLDDATAWLNRWQRESAPISAACHLDDTLYIRLSGPEQSIDSGSKSLGSESNLIDNNFWKELNEQRLAFFSSDAPLYRVNVPVTSRLPEQAGRWLVDWAGQQRWLYSSMSLDEVQLMAAAEGGNACAFRNGNRTNDVFQTLPAPLMAIERRIKQVLDPEHILNPGRMYKDL